MGFFHKKKSEPEKDATIEEVKQFKLNSERETYRLKIAKSKDAQNKIGRGKGGGYGNALSEFTRSFSGIGEGAGGGRHTKRKSYSERKTKTTDAKKAIWG